MLRSSCNHRRLDIGYQSQGRNAEHDYILVSRDNNMIPRAAALAQLGERQTEVDFNHYIYLEVVCSIHTGRKIFAFPFYPSLTIFVPTS